MKAALVIIDVQNGWLDMSSGLKRSVEERLGYMREAVSLFRAAGAPVIFTYHACPALGLEPGGKGFELHPGLAAVEADGKVVKDQMNAFNGTDLERIVRERGCDTVVLMGLSATQCVLATYYGAFDKSLSPYLVRDAVCSAKEENVQLAERLCDTLSLKALSQILGNDGNKLVGHGDNYAPAAEGRA
jgi:nicotinamidase-related amidase